MRKKGLMNRVLASILCATLVFQNVSVTSYATESNVEAEAEVTAEENVEEVSENTDADSQAEADSEQSAETPVSEAAPAEETKVEEVKTEEVKTEETQTSEVTSETSATEIVTEEATETVVTEAVAEETVVANTTTEETVVANETTEETVEVAEEAATRDVYTIVDEINDRYKTAVYDGESQFDTDNGDIFYNITIKKNNEYYKALYNELNWDNEFSTSITWKQKDKDGNYVTIDGNPVDAGSYKLVVELPAVEGDSGHDAASIEIDFTIEKAKLIPEVSLDIVKPGTKASDVQVNSLGVINSKTGKYIWYQADDSETKDVNENENSKLKFTKKVRNAITNEVLTDDAVLLRNVDYVVDFEIAFTDKATAEETANYEIETKVSKDIRFNMLVDTTVVVKLADKWKPEAEEGQEAPEATQITYKYTGVAAVEPVENTDYTVKVQESQSDKTDAEGNPVYTEVTDAQLVASWCDEYHNALQEAPVNAGTYYYKLSYEGKEGIYDDSYEYIKVVIEPVELTIRPSIKEGAVFYEGTSVKDVLAQVEYKVFDGETEFAIDKGTFWGTSYDKSGNTQPYEPVFYVQELVKETDAEGKDVIVPERLYSYNTLKKDKSYRVIFSEYKSTYDFKDDGENTDWLHINENDVHFATDNYKVLVGDVLEKHVASVTVTAGTQATIDVSAILKDGKGATYDNPISKVYDTEAIYALRSEYKKAIVKTTDKEVAKNADKSITYTWYKQSGTTIEGEGENAKEVPAWEVADLGSNVRYNSPIDAGNYKLVVTYSDSKHVYHAKSAEVFYKIDKQKVKVVPTGEYTALTNTSVWDFLNSGSTDITYEIWTVPATGEAQKLEWRQFFYDTEYNENGYDVYWTVERKTAEGTWESALYGTFEKDTEYRLAVDELSVYGMYDNYVNYELVTENDVEIKKYLNETAPITLKVMGEAELEVKVDETKLTTKTKVYDGQPIDISADIENGLIELVKKADQTDASDITPSAYIGYWLENDEYEEVDAPVNGGSYTYYVQYLGDEKYKAFDAIPTVTVTITKKEVTVKLEVNEPVVAGTYAENVCNYNKVEFDGIIDADKDAFTYKRHYSYYEESWVMGWPALEYLNVTVFDENRNPVYEERLKGDKTYTLECTGCSLEYRWYRNYDIKKTEVVTFTTLRGNSRVEESSYMVEAVKLKDTIDGMNHVITLREGVPFSYDVVDDKDGNYVAVRIVKPSEYDYMPGTAMYKNSLKAAGAVYVDYADSYIEALFDASAKDKKEFDIRWEDNYVEHFTLDLTNAVLMDDLTKAVAPKSIKFINAPKKMVVGNSRQLDVALTKQQESDIIRLVYDTDNTDVLCVTEYGYITALKAGNATVTVYPARQAEDGKLVAIDGAKSAKVKIKVSDVTAPKITKVVPVHNGAEVYFTNTNDGYRKEIYVLEGKKTAADFETAIDSMKNGIWKDIFAVQPKFVYWNDDYEYVSGLSTDTEYTVYVRNVSAVRETSDGCKVTESVAGAVKTFMTTKEQVYELKLDYNHDDVKYNDYYDAYTIELSKGSTNVTVEGLFAEIGENEYADDTDGVWYKLPLTKEQQKNYVNPKLVYYVGNMSEYNGSGYLFAVYDEWYEEYRYLYPTNIAKIDKKGKLKLNGVGTVDIVVVDQNTSVSNSISLRILASADSIVGKSAKLQVGDYVSLESLLTYKNGKKVLTGDYAVSVVYDEALIKAVNDSEYFEFYNGYNIRAIKPGGTLELKVKDANVPNSEATVKLTSTALEPVKGLKTELVTDQYVDISFTHSGTPEAFLIELTDARGSKISSNYVDSFAVSLGNGTYKHRIANLVKKSKYNLTVTALFKDEVSKSVKKSFTTTLMPASYIALGEYQYGGVDVRVQYADVDSCNVEEAYFVTGNTYTLNTTGNKLNIGARYAKTDKLIWSSSNKKVATVTPNAGTFTATLKATGQGWTVIEVKSSITKAVIARYELYVNAVKQGYGYYGDNEKLESQEIKIPQQLAFVDVEAGEYQILSYTAGKDGDYRFYSGNNTGDPKAWFFYEDIRDYDYWTIDDIRNEYNYCNDDSNGNGNFSQTIYLSEGETIYVVVSHYNFSSHISASVYVEEV